VIHCVADGLPETDAAELAADNGKWRILRTRNGVRGEWTGDYATADEALAALQKEFDANSTS
jgi:hypothetical protein